MALTTPPTRKTHLQQGSIAREPGTLRSMRRRKLAVLPILICGLAAPGVASAKPHSPLHRVDHIVVLYQENHSFDNLYGGWEGVNGLRRADAAHTRQVNQSGSPYTCLKQNDPNLSTP